MDVQHPKGGNGVIQVVDELNKVYALWILSLRHSGY